MTGQMLILFTPRGVPCELDPDRPTHTRCGLDAKHGRRISEAQALVFLFDRRCSRCSPVWETSKARQFEAANRRRS